MMDMELLIKKKEKRILELRKLLLESERNNRYEAADALRWAIFQLMDFGGYEVKG